MKVPDYSYKFSMTANSGFRKSLEQRLQVEGAKIISNSPEGISFSNRGSVFLKEAPLLYRWFSFGKIRITVALSGNDEWNVTVDPVARRMASILFFCLVSLGVFLSYFQNGNLQQLATGVAIVLFLIVLSASLPPPGEYVGIKRYFENFCE